MKKLTFLLFLGLITLTNLTLGQSSFSWSPNDTMFANLPANQYTQLKMEQINNLQNNDTLNLAIEVVYNDLPNDWDGMVCVYGMCLGTIPPVGETTSMQPIFGSAKGYVRLTVNPMNNLKEATLRIRVYNKKDPEDSDTATWILNSQLLNVPKYKQNASFTVYPNPSQSGKINIKTPLNFDAVRIVNLNGQELSYYPSNLHISNSTVDVSDFEAGLYHVQLIQNEIIIGNQKVFIQ